MKRWGIAVLLALALPASAGAWMPHYRYWHYHPGVLLVYPDGSPVGGVWQQWADEAKVPTAPLRVTFKPLALCDITGVPAADGCSANQPYELAAGDREALYFELGHIFDGYALSPLDRAHLRHLWGVRGRPPWSSTVARLDEGTEDGLSIDFAAAYMYCALGEGFTGLQSGLAPAISESDRYATCRFIRDVGHRDVGPIRRPSS